jgi:hypothetical protein
MGHCIGLDSGSFICKNGPFDEDDHEAMINLDLAHYISEALNKPMNVQSPFLFSFSS